MKFASLVQFTKLTVANTTLDERFVAAKCMLFDHLQLANVDSFDINTLTQLESECGLTENNPVWIVVVRSTIEVGADESTEDNHGMEVR